MFVIFLTGVITQLLRVRLRKPKNIAWLESLTTPIENLWIELRDFRLLMLDWLLVTIQTDFFQTKLRVLYPVIGGYNVYVRTYFNKLNNTYNNYIGEHRLQEFDYNLGETTPTPYYRTVYNIYEWSNSWQYQIVMPIAYTSLESEIRGYLNRYKPAGKTYELIFENI